MPYFGILNIFPHFLWMNNFIEYSRFCWMNIFWMNILDFVLNWIIFRPDSMKKWIFRTYRPGLPKDVIAPIMRNGQALPVVGRLWACGDDDKNKRRWWCVGVLRCRWRVIWPLLQTATRRWASLLNNRKFNKSKMFLKKPVEKSEI